MQRKFTMISKAAYDMVFSRAGRLRILCANCAFALRTKAYFFKVALICVAHLQSKLRFRNLHFKKITAQIAQALLDYLSKCCNSAFVKAIVLKENVKKNRN